MAQARREMEGEAVAMLVRLIPTALMDVANLEAAIGVHNTFKVKPPESAMMRAHKAKLAAMRFAAATGGA